MIARIRWSNVAAVLCGLALVGVMVGWPLRSPEPEVPPPVAAVGTPLATPSPSPVSTLKVRQSRPKGRKRAAAPGQVREKQEKRVRRVRPARTAVPAVASVAPAPAPVVSAPPVVAAPAPMERASPREFGGFER